MKQLNRRQLRDDRLLKSMARADQMKADLNNSGRSELERTIEFGKRATSSPSHFLTNRIRPSRTQVAQWWSDSSELT